MSGSSSRWKAAAMAFSLLSFFQPLGFSQDTPDPHEEHAWHIGLIVGPVYNFDSKKWSLDVGAEYEHVLPHRGRLLGIGVVAEADLGEHRHYEARFPVRVHPLGELTLFLAPGVQISEHEESRVQFAAHIGAEYELELDKYFLAPEFDVAYVGGGFHITLGIHVGLGFQGRVGPGLTKSF